MSPSYETKVIYLGGSTNITQLNLRGDLVIVANHEIVVETVINLSNSAITMILISKRSTIEINNSIGAVDILSFDRDSLNQIPKESYLKIADKVLLSSIFTLGLTTNPLSDEDIE